MGCMYGEGMYEPGGGGGIPGIICYEGSQGAGDVVDILRETSHLTRVVLRVSVNVGAGLRSLLGGVLLIRGRWHRRGDWRGEVW